MNIELILFNPLMVVLLGYIVIAAALTLLVQPVRLHLVEVVEELALVERKHLVGVHAVPVSLKRPPLSFEFASSAIATLPAASRSPMIPEPTTAASNIAVPTASATRRWGSG